jgi:hypothetical protein
MNFLDYLYTRLDFVNQERAKITTNNQRLIWLNGQREILLSIIFDMEETNKIQNGNSKN